MSPKSPTIQFAGTFNPPTSNPAGGVFSVRSKSVAGVGSLKPGRSRLSIKPDPESKAEEDEDQEHHTSQTFHGWKLFFLAYQSIGVIYGDIGTSPLYVFSSTFQSDPSFEDILGVLSFIIWSLTLMVTVKYVFIILHADDEGEGGTFAVFSLLARYANIVRRSPKEASRTKIQRAQTSDLGWSALATRNILERSAFLQGLLKVVGVFGVSLVMSDGILTPAQSVLGSIQGITVVAPDLSQGAIVGISCAILVCLFLIQPFGTTKLAHAFAPIILVWLIFNGVFGLYNIIVYDHEVLKAFSPYFAGSYLVRNKEEGWKSLGGILLCFTGCEALFADLGAFTRRAVQISWLAYVYPCLLLSYIGQASYIAHNPGAWSNPFFNSVPPGCFWPSFILSIFAAIVASQAMITAVFQLLTQMMKLSYFPQIKIVHTSSIYFGQIYLPLANWLLMIGTVLVTGIFNDTTRLGHAYGVCVILVTFITTNLVTLVALIVWRLPVYLVLPVWLIFIVFDGLFLSSALTKVPEGAWFTLLLAIILSSTFILWRYGKEQQWTAEKSDRFPLSHMLMSVTDPKSSRPRSSSSSSRRPQSQPVPPQTTSNTSQNQSSLRLTHPFGNHDLTQISGIGVFFDKEGSPSSTPTVFVHFLQKFHATFEIMIFFHLRALQTPTVSFEERFRVTRCEIGTGIPAEEDPKGMTKPAANCFRAVVRHGYNDQVVTNDLGMLITEQIRGFMITEQTKLAKSQQQFISEKNRTEVKTNIGEIGSPIFEDIPLEASGAVLEVNSSELTNNEKGKTTDVTRPVSQEKKPKPRARTRTLTDLDSSDHLPLSDKLSLLQKAYDSQIVYIVGQEQLRVASNSTITITMESRLGSDQSNSTSLKRKRNRIWRRLVLEIFVWIRENTRSKVQALNVSVDKLVEVGFVKEF